MTNNDNVVTAIDRALELIIYLQRQGEEVGISQIARDLGEHKSTIFRTLNTLERRGFVYQNLQTGRYWLGSRFFSLGKAVEHHTQLSDMVKPYTKKLYDMYKEVVNVSILERNPGGHYMSVLVQKEESPTQMLTVNPPVGSVSECHCSSVGKCLLAFSDNIDLSVYKDEDFIRYTDKSIVSVEGLRSELIKIKTDGFAMDNEELEIGLTCIGAPILDRYGKAVAAISLSGPTSRMLKGNFLEKIDAVKRTAREISINF